MVEGSNPFCFSPMYAKVDKGVAAGVLILKIETKMKRRRTLVLGTTFTGSLDTNA